MWTSPKYQTRIAADRQTGDIRQAANDRRAATTTEPVDDHRPASTTTSRRRLLVAFRFLRA